MRLITYLSTVKTWQVYIGFINSYGIHIGIVINSNGQFSSPLQWQLWTLFLDTVNYSIFFGINSEPQYFQPPAPAQKKTPFWTPQLWKSPQTWHILNQLTGQTLKGQNPTIPKCKDVFFKVKKPSRFHPFFGTWNVSNIDAWHVWSAAVQ